MSAATATKAEKTEKPAEKKARNYVHVEFDKTTCPVKGCTSGPDKGPQVGTVPGIKRHVARVHPDAKDTAKYPPIRAEK